MKRANPIANLLQKAWGFFRDWRAGHGEHSFAHINGVRNYTINDPDTTPRRLFTPRFT